MDLSIIIVAYNVKELMEKCLQHILQSQDHFSKEIIYVDNGSKDGSVDMVRNQFPEVHIIESPTNLGFIGANNLGYRAATGKYILLLNSDAFIKADTLEILINFMDKTTDCGIVGCKAIRADGSLLPSIRFFPTPWRIFLMKTGLSHKLPCFKEINPTQLDENKIQECDWVTGCCLLIRKSIVDNLDFLLRPELFMYNDDNDLCLRVKKKGWKVYYHPTEIVHLSGINNDKVAKAESDPFRVEKLILESDYIYMRKNHGLLTAWAHFSLIILHNLLESLKSVYKPNRAQILQDRKQFSSLAWSIFKQTNFGAHPISRC